MNTESILPVLLELLIKSTLIASAAALLLRAWRGATAAQRHLVWLVTLATVITLPLTRLVSPLWKIPLGSAKKTPVFAAVRPIAHTAPLEVTVLMGDLVAALPERRPFDWRLAVLGMWCGGAALLLGYRLIGSWRLHGLLRRSAAVDDPRIQLLHGQTFRELGLQRRPNIRFSEECQVPITWGSWRPVMLLPTAALDWSDDWLLAAMRHEGAHIRRYDHLTRWFAHVACALYWPNPLVWLLARSLRAAQELAADDLVLQAGTPPEEYASQLIDAARSITTHGFFVRQAVAMACPSTLEDRVLAIVDDQRDRRPLSRWATTCGSLSMALVLSLSTAAQVRSDQEKPAEPQAPSESKPASEPKADVKQKTVSRGKILAVNSAWNFVVLNAGANRGVTVNTTALVVRGDQTIALLHITTVEPSTSIADVEADSVPKGITLQAGDTVTFESTVAAAPPRDGLMIREWKLPSGVISDGAKAASPKGWLISKGVKFEGTATAAYVPGTSRLMVRNTQEQLDLVEQIISTAVADKAAKDSASLEGGSDEEFLRRSYLAFLGRPSTPDELRAFLADPQPSRDKRIATIAKLSGQFKTSGTKVNPTDSLHSAAREKAEQIIIPAFELKDATLFTALELLRQKAVESDPQKTGVKIVLLPDRAKLVQISLSLRELPVIEILRYITNLADAELIVTPDALQVRPSDGGIGARLKELQGRVVALSKTPPANPDPFNPSNLFLDVFLTAQKAEKFEAQGDFKFALESFQKAAQGIEELSTAYPDWNPAVVAYRKGKIARSLEQLQAHSR